MNKYELKLLSKFKRKSSINKDEYVSVKHLEKLGLVNIDKFYKNNLNGILIEYAEITDFGLEILKTNKWYYNIPFLKNIF
ncbi:MAG: hypothetical protein ACOCP4_06420 [Candidatus Woesearchaeota archaeon]